MSPGDGSGVLRQERNEIYGLGDFRALEGLRSQGGQILRKEKQNKNPMLHTPEAKMDGQVRYN
jgi:hypothetical protein